MKMTSSSRYLLLILVHQGYLQVACNIFNGENKKLSDVPGTIPADITDLRLNHNYIREASTIPPLPVRSLYITHNLLTEFPDLSNISSTLEILVLNQNYISVISPERLDQLSVMMTLQMKNNLLTNFPDTAGPKIYTLFLESNMLTNVPLLPKLGPNIRTLALGKTIKTLTITRERLANFPNLLSLHINACGLTTLPEALLSRATCPLLRRLEIGGNSIRSIPIEFLAVKTKLRVLDLSGTKVSTLPNVCLARKGFRKHLYMQSAPIRCDRNLWPLKLADSRGRVIVRDLVCDSPPEEAGKTWADANLDHPTPDGSSQNFSEVTNFYCGGSSTVLYNLTRQGCAENCRDTAGCFGFNFAEDWSDFGSTCGRVGLPYLSGGYATRHHWFMALNYYDDTL